MDPVLITGGIGLALLFILIFALGFLTGMRAINSRLADRLKELESQGRNKFNYVDINFLIKGKDE